MEEVISKNELIKNKFKLLGLDCPTELIAQWAIKEQITDKNYDTVLSLLDCIKMLRDRNRCKLIKSMSRLPQIAQRTFDNFDISRISAMNKEMLDAMKSALSDDVQVVRFTNRLKNHPVCLTSEGGISLEMEKVINSMPTDQNVKAQKVLEINEDHPIAQKLKKIYAEDKELLKEYTKILYSQARLIEGMTIDNPTEISNIICDLLSK